ncbi:winged helix-turn-helix domain-containing protein [Novosphingobium bradum]|uniref:Winged helix-turn-helix domain-containing protein n=1 Tax=Novosphingobium bradum TaxID=1737444 RepID=A0ABV7IJY4_9SPHN
MRQFGWLGTERIPPGLDLRRDGWSLVNPPDDLASASFPLLLPELGRAIAIRSVQVRARVIVTGIADPATRVHLLALDFGEVIAPEADLAELGLRARRVAQSLGALPRRRAHGPVLLDLLHREGWVGRHRLGLHPREFALLWRLAESPGVAVSPGTLLNEVWHLPHRPETNSLAVHVCRLRAKLAGVGLADLLHTSPGGYLLSQVPDEPTAARPGSADPGGAAANNRVAMPGACG